MLLASRLFLIVLCGGALATLGSDNGHAHPQSPEPRVSPFMRVYGPTLPPSALSASASATTVNAARVRWKRRASSSRLSGSTNSITSIGRSTN